MSRQPTPEDPNTNPGTSNSSPVSPNSSHVGRADTSEQPSSSHSPHRRMSKDSEGYPSWLPKRPPPPAPASTFASSLGGMHDPSPVDPVPQFIGGRKPTPRSVRIVSLQDDFITGAAADTDRREPTDQTRVPSNPTRVWSRATGAGVSAFSSSDPYALRIPQPKFNSRGLHLELLRSPSKLSRLYYYLFPIILFYHIPLQTFFDFNAVFILLQVSKFPNPQAPGVPGSGKNWALGAAAYVACWLVWILVIFIVYELIYSFARRWRVKRPLMLHIYLSTPAFNYAALSSYTNFCFLQHIRYTAFFGEHGSFRDGLAETFYYYSQNLPTVVLLIPRAGLALSLLLSFTTPQASVQALVANGQHLGRDGTFFRSDGTLTDYARGVLIANCAWTVWRVLILWTSWIGLWIVSGQGCAGLCGPRYRWEEEDQEKSRYSVYSDTGSDQADALPWSWRECTRMRIQDAYEFCLTVRPSLRWGKGKEAPVAENAPTSEEMQQVLAAVGFPSVPPPARRGVLTDDLFASPEEKSRSPELSDIIPKAVLAGKDRQQTEGGPLMKLPYPFTKPGAGKMSSQDQVPFPPSSREGSQVPGTASVASGTRSRTSGTSEAEEEEEEEDEEEEEEEEEEVEEGVSPTSEEPSTRASGSMSSLGQPVSSRYPFQFRQPRGSGSNSGRGGSASSGAPTSHGTRSMVSGSVVSQSTGNRPSTDSQSPMSLASSSRPRASLSQSSAAQSGVIPMPPRHPQQPRQRAGTVPVPGAAPVEFPSVRRRADSGVPGVNPAYVDVTTDEEEELEEEEEDEDEELDRFHDQPDDDEELGSEEAGEREDRVGLLSAVGSRTSLTHRNSRSRLSLSLHGSSGSDSPSSRSRSNSRSRANSSHSSLNVARSRANSIGISVRERTQSLMQSVGHVSQTSLDLVRNSVRSRANSSMARLEEDVTATAPGVYSGSSGEERVRARSGVDPTAEMEYYSSSGGTHSRSGSGSVSGAENYTFGQPVAFLRHHHQVSRDGTEGGERRRSPSHLREEVASADEGDDAVVASSPEIRGRQQQPDGQSPSTAHLSVSEQMSSGLSAAFHSAQASERTASPATPATPVPGRYAQEQEQEYEDSERAGVSIPIGSWPRRQQGDSSEASTSPPDISTAAGSFVTTPATLEGATTESSGARTIGRSEASWEGGRMAQMMGGMAGQHGQMMGEGREDPSGGGWRVQ